MRIQLSGNGDWYLRLSRKRFYGGVARTSSNPESYWVEMYVLNLSKSVKWEARLFMFLGFVRAFLSLLIDYEFPFVLLEIWGVPVEGRGELDFQRLVFSISHKPLLRGAIATARSSLMIDEILLDPYRSLG